jgi:hypothetical protein
LSGEKAMVKRHIRTKNCAVICTALNKADPITSETNRSGAGRFYIGMTRDEVNITINALKRNRDKYEDVEETRNEIAKIYKSPYFVFAFDDCERLIYISTNQNVYSTPLGLTSGDSIKRMRDLYGNNYLHYSDAESESELYEYQAAGNYLDIMIKDNKVLWWGLSKNEVGEFELAHALDFVKERSFFRGKKWTWYAFSKYMKKPHYCPECNSQMEAKKVERVVNSKSPEARNFDFSSVDGYLIGLIKFTWDEFHCPKCGNQLTVPQMKKYERQKNIV